MTVKEYLSRALEIKKKIKLLYQRIAELRALESSVPGVNYDQEVVDRTRSLEAPFVKYIFKRIETEEIVKAEEAKLIEVKKEIASTISEVESPVHQQLLRLRYLDFETWSDISGIMGYTKDNVYKLHRQALEKIILWVKYGYTILLSRNHKSSML